MEDCVRDAECAFIKEWPKFQKIDFFWRMPLDNQRVMIFEKIEFAVTSYDKEREKIKSNSEANSADREPRHEESVNLEDLHADVMKNLFKQVKQIKKLYRKKLPDYALQV